MKGNEKADKIAKKALEKEKVEMNISLRPRPHKAETGETVTVSIYPVSKYLRKDEAKRNRVDL